MAVSLKYDLTNQHLLDTLETFPCSEQAFEQVLTRNYDKLSKLLSYYRPRSKASEAALKAGECKWRTKTYKVSVASPPFGLASVVSGRKPVFLRCSWKECTVRKLTVAG